MRLYCYEKLLPIKKKMPREWGTPLWKLLHGLAESLGKQTNAILATDEAHEIVFLLRDVEKVMPCQLCRLHYNAWRKAHPLEQIGALRGQALREGVKRWLFDLHENVNRDRKIQSGISYEQLSELYATIDIRGEWGKFFELMKASTEVGLVSQTILQNFHRHLGILRKLIGR
jgi:hypothetical protein